MFLKLTTLATKQTACARSAAVEFVEAKIGGDGNVTGATVTMSSGQSLTVVEQVADIYKLLQKAF